MESETDLQIVNTTVTTKLSSIVDLLKLASRYPPPLRKRHRRKRQTQKFNHTRIGYPHSQSIHFLVYPNGKCVLLGCKSLPEIERAISWIHLETGSGSDNYYVVHNMVGSFRGKHVINLKELYGKIKEARGEKQFFGYMEPEMSPSFVYAPLCIPKARCLIFRSGSCILTGVKSVTQLQEVYKEVKHLLLK